MDIHTTVPWHFDYCLLSCVRILLTKHTQLCKPALIGNVDLYISYPTVQSTKHFCSRIRKVSLVLGWMFAVLVLATYVVFFFLQLSTGGNKVGRNICEAENQRFCENNNCYITSWLLKVFACFICWIFVAFTCKIQEIMFHNMKLWVTTTSSLYSGGHSSPGLAYTQECLSPLKCEIVFWKLQWTFLDSGWFEPV